MLGPKLPNVEASNKYTPQEGPKVETEKVMATPHYRGINIQHS